MTSSSLQWFADVTPTLAVILMVIALVASREWKLAIEVAWTETLMMFANAIVMVVTMIPDSFGYSQSCRSPFPCFSSAIAPSAHFLSVSKRLAPTLRYETLQTRTHDFTSFRAVREVGHVGCIANCNAVLWRADLVRAHLPHDAGPDNHFANPMERRGSSWLADVANVSVDLHRFAVVSGVARVFDHAALPLFCRHNHGQ